MTLKRPIDPEDVDLCDECGNVIVKVNLWRASRSKETWLHLMNKGREEKQLTGGVVRKVYVEKKCPNTSRPEASPCGEMVVEESGSRKEGLG